MNIGWLENSFYSLHVLFYKDELKPVVDKIVALPGALDDIPSVRVLGEHWLHYVHDAAGRANQKEGHRQPEEFSELRAMHNALWDKLAETGESPVAESPELDWMMESAKALDGMRLSLLAHELQESGEAIREPLEFVMSHVKKLRAEVRGIAQTPSRVDVGPDTRSFVRKLLREKRAALENAVSDIDKAFVEGTEIDPSPKQFLGSGAFSTGATKPSSSKPFRGNSRTLSNGSRSTRRDLPRSQSPRTTTLLKSAKTLLKPTRTGC